MISLRRVHSKVLSQNSLQIGFIDTHNFRLVPLSVRPALSAFFPFLPQKQWGSCQTVSPFFLTENLHIRFVRIFPWLEFCIFTRSRFFFVEILHSHSAGISSWPKLCMFSRQRFVACPSNCCPSRLTSCCVHIFRLHYFPFLFCKAMYCCKYLPNISRACLACWHVGWPAQYNTWLLSQRGACALSRLPLLILNGIGTLTLCILIIKIICSFTKFNASTVLRSFLSSPHPLAFKALTRWTSRSPH